MKKNIIQKLVAMALTSAVVIGGVFGVATSQVEASGLKGKIVITGSSALLPMTSAAAKDFKKDNPGVTISVSAPSSIAGPQAVTKGAAQIGACDWDATQAVPGFPAFKGLVAHKVAIIPFAVIVNKKVNVDTLTTAQLRDIYSGKITNWKQVGGSDAEIIVVNRKFGSGTRVNFDAKALNNLKIDDKVKNGKVAGTTGEMTTSVGTIEGSIGYCDLAYVKADSAFKAIKIDGIEATKENIISGKYKFWSYGYYLTKGQPTGEVKAFIDYVQGKKFQQSSITKLGFIPVSSMK